MNKEKLAISKEEFMLLMDEICDVKSGTVKAGDFINNNTLFDSLSMLGLIAMLDKKFSLSFSMDELSELVTVGNLFDKIVQS